MQSRFQKTLTVMTSMSSPLCASHANKEDVLENRIAEINCNLWRFDDIDYVTYELKVDFSQGCT